MEKEINIDIIKETQTSLGKYVKRPPLSEKLLKKPPFRFLHDIFTTVLKTTGFFEGLFDEQELISENVKDRESKILFLNKVVSVVGLTLDKKLTVKSSKIVAGQEPEKTNELLQCLAQALDLNLSSTEAVKKLKKNGIHKEKKTADTKSNDNKKIISRSSEKINGLTKENLEKSKTKSDEKKEKSVVSTEQTQKKPIQKVLRKKISKDGKSRDGIREVTDSEYKDKSKEDLSSENTQSKIEKPIENKIIQLTQHSVIDDTSSKSYNVAENNISTLPQDLLDQDKVNVNLNEAVESETVSIIENEVVISNSNTSKDSNIGTQDINSVIEDQSISLSQNDDSKMTQEVDKPLVNKNSEDSNNASQYTNNKLRPSSVRPSSSRPGAPRPKEKHDNIIIDPENLLVGKVHIIVENSTAEEDEDSSIIVVDQHEALMKDQETTHDQSFLKEHGVLVHQILESQKELSQKSGKTEIEWELGTRNAMEIVNQEVENLRFNIQAVSRVANPLGKLLDHIQEDVEVMRQELQQWKNTHNDSHKELLKQKMATEDFMFPLQTKLKQHNMDIKDKHDKINDLRIVIHKNYTRIEKLLAMGSVHSI